MAETLDKFPDHVSTRTLKYPWDTWLDGQVWQLTMGEDFDTSPLKFAANARNVGRGRGLTVATLRQGDSVIIQAKPRS